MSRHFREREETLPRGVAISLSPSEIGRAELHGMTGTGTNRGTAYLGPDQAQENVRSGGMPRAQWKTAVEDMKEVPGVINRGLLGRHPSINESR